MPALGNLQIDCSCGQILSVPVTVEPAGYHEGQEPNTLTGTLRIDHPVHRRPPRHTRPLGAAVLRNLIWRLLGQPPSQSITLHVDGKALAKTVRTINAQEPRR